MTRPVCSSSAAGFVGAQENAVADARGFARFGLARRHDADFRRRAVLLFVPFGGDGDQFAVASRVR